MLLFLTSLIPAGAGAAELVVVAHPAIPETTIDNKDVQRIFLGKQTQWRDDTTIVPVMLKSDPLHDDFIERFVGRSVPRFVTYWRQMVFTGKGVPPKLFASESELIDFVAATPGSVGFTSAKADMAGVKILLSD
jgi:hypothetical protein